MTSFIELAQFNPYGYTVIMGINKFT